MKRQKILIKEKKWLLAIFSCIGVVFLFAAFIMYKQEIGSAMGQPKVVMAVKQNPTWSNPAELVPLKKDSVIEQQISMVGSEITGFSLYLEEGTKDAGEVVVCLKDEKERVLNEWRIAAEDIEGSGFRYFYLPEVKTTPGAIFTIAVTVEDGDGIPAYIRMINLRNYKGENILLHKVDAAGINTEETGYSLSYEIVNGDSGALRYFFVLLVVCMLCFIGAVFLLAVFKPKKEWIFVTMALLLGIAYMLLIPPYVVPDEGSHFVTAYAKSSPLLGKTAEDENGNVILSPEAASYLARQENPTHSTYPNYIRGLLGKDGNTLNESVSSRKALNVSTLGYVPQIMGLIIGRLFHFNSEWLFLSGRIGALLWYCFIMFWSIRLIPGFAKNILMVAGLTPMTMQLAMSYNYDSVLIGAVFFLTAYLLYLAYDNRKQKVSLWDCIWIMVALIVIVPLKVVYIPVLGLGLLIPAEKFGGIRGKIYAGGIFLATSAAALLATRLSTLLRMAEASESAHGLAATYSLAECLGNPVHTVVIFWNTLCQNFAYYVETMLANGLGWLEISMPGVITYGFMLLLLLSILRTKEEEKFWKYGERIWFFVMAAGSAFLVCLALLLDWTSIDAAVISGIQGRYFIPLIPLVLLALQNRVILLKKDIDDWILGGVCVLQLMAVLNTVSFIVVR